VQLRPGIKTTIKTTYKEEQSNLSALAPLRETRKRSTLKETNRYQTNKTERFSKPKNRKTEMNPSKILQSIQNIGL
jgi:hypothetical protein